MRIVLNTFGSLGDLHPYLAVGVGLKTRGHEVVIATSAMYRDKVEADGLEFCPVRPDLSPLHHDTGVQRRVWDRRHGTEYLIRELVLPHLEDSFEDLREACMGADVLVTHILMYAAPSVGEVLGIPVIPVALQPSPFLSAYDPPLLAPAPWTHGLRHFGPIPFRTMVALASLRTAAWARPIFEMRRRLGLPAPVDDPILNPMSLPHGQAMAWFSPLLARPQPDWPTGTIVTGFPFYDSSALLSQEMETFLDRGHAPVVFTLGSAAVLQAGNFYVESAAVAKLLERRAVLLVGQDADEAIWALASETIHVAAYAPYSALFPRCAAAVHQCGVGTVGETLRASIPMLGVPWGHDQFDNAERVRQLGCGAMLSRRRYTAARAVKALEQLLVSPAYRRRAEAVSWEVRVEDGVRTACKAIERMAG